MSPQPSYQYVDINAVDLTEESAVLVFTALFSCRLQCLERGRISA